MSMDGLQSRVRPALALALLLMAAGGAASADKMIAVEWTNPEIASFVAAKARSLGPEADDKLAKLKLPVVGFAATPGLVENTFRGAGPRPATERDVLMDEDNPIWYQIVERYGDLTVSVSADLRIQHEFPDSYPVYSNPSRAAGPQAGPTVSVFDDRLEGGEEGYLAEYTITRYGVPYSVTVECTGEAKDQCRNTSQISKDSELLTLIRANPPKQ